MDNYINVNKVRSNAQNWSLEGDNYLLECMKQISENLERRSSSTSSSLQQLSSNLTRTHIALDNAANSLNALQYSQFVESRCHNDDETLLNPADVPVGAINGNNEETKSSNEIIKAFLKNNLNMLANCHEKYELDFQDSDEEDSINKYIYQPKNPYNERLLPHIYGSKLWKDTPHVGLCDNANNYSEDEQSDKYSESSNTQDDDNDEIFESTTNISTSSISITNDKRGFAQNEAPPSRAESLHSQEPVQRAFLSSTKKTTDVEVATNAAGSNTDNRNDLFTSLDDTPPCTSTSSTGTVSGSSSLSSPSLPKAVRVLPSELPQHKRHSIETEPINERDKQQSVTETQHPQSKRKPINLFDDDLFGKAQSKPEDSKQNHQPSPLNQSANTRPADKVKPIEVPKPKPKVNLFESPDVSPTTEEAPFKDNFLSAASSSALRVTQVPTTRMPTRSLFDDDDDDDDDFLNVFQTNKNAKPSFLTKQLFNDDEENEKAKVDEITTTSPQDSTDKAINKDNELISEKPMQKSFTSGLFEDENDLFDTQVYHQPQPTAAPRSNTIKTPAEQRGQQQNLLKSIIIEDASDDEDGLFGKFSQSPTKIGVHKNETPPSKEFDNKLEDSQVSKQESQIIEESKMSIPKTDEKVHAPSQPTKGDEFVSPKKQKSPEVGKTSSQHYTNIFLDEPPDDDDFFQTLGNNQLSASKLTLDIEQDFYEPALPQPPSTDVTPPTNEQKQSTYSGLNLFSEIPPDDDGADYENVPTTTEPTKQVHSVFYNDFDETLEALRATTNTTQYSLFTDEPPPDGGDGVQKPKPKEVVQHSDTSKDELDHQVIENQNADNQISATRNKEHVSSHRPHGISKLKMPNININVKALMPTPGKTPNYKTTQVEAKDGNDTQQTKGSTVNGVREVVPGTDRPQDPNVLTNVCKTRVRAPLNRKPSTRLGRHESYRRSMMAEEEQIKHFESMPSDIAADQKPKQIVEDKKIADQKPSKITNNSTTKPSNSDQKSSTITNNSTTKPSNSDQKKSEDAFEPKLDKIEDKLVSDAKNSVVSNQPNTGPKKKNVLQAFLDDDEDDDDDFLFQITQKTVKNKSSTAIQKDKSSTKSMVQSDSVSSYLFEEPPEDSNDVNKKEETIAAKKPDSYSLFEEPPEDSTFSNANSSSDVTASISKSVDEKFAQRGSNEDRKPYEVTLTNVNFLHADQPPEDPFFAAKVQEQPIATEKNADKTSLLKALERSTGGEIKPMKAQIKATASLFGDSDDDADDLFDSMETVRKKLSTSTNVPSKITAVKTTTKATVNSSLFSSDDTDEDDVADLFKKASKSTASVDKTSKPLFGDDSNGSDNDELFSSSSKATRNPPSAKGGGGTLFSDIDDDDDDDLFGAKSNVKPTKTTTNKKPSTKIPQPSSAVTKLSDNPLADLLDS